MSFPQCHYAGREIEPGLRDCHAPQVVGLKIVSPQMCAGCVYRETQATKGHEDISLSDLFPCALRGEPCGQNGEEVFACRHPLHKCATATLCRGCPDYLFPQMAPELPTAIAARLLPVINPQLQTHGWWLQENAQHAFRHSADEFIRSIPSYPGGFRGRGIVIAGGGKYFVSAYITVRVLRHVGCTLPIELWHLAGEIDDRQRALLAKYAVTCQDAQAHPSGADFPWHATWWKGWQLKPFAIRHSSFREVLYLDADCYPVRDPSDLFDWQVYAERGAIFFPDLEETKGLMPAAAPTIFGVPHYADHPCESGQLVINKELCWRELQLALHYNHLAEFTYRHLWGDKDTFPIAWKRLGREYARLWPTASRTAHVNGILHYDQTGEVLFQHRCGDKFRLPEVQFDSNSQQHSSPCYQPGLKLEDFCFAALADLRAELTDFSGPMDATMAQTGIPRAVQAATNGQFVLSPKIAASMMTSHLSIQEMYPPVSVQMLTSSEWQQKFKEQFVDSGEFPADPFEVADCHARAQRKCFSVSLFNQNVDNHRPHELAADVENWERKYWRGLLGLIQELPDFPEWKLRIYVEDSLWEMVRHELGAHSQIELYHMRVDSVGAGPGVLWRYMALDDDSLDVVLATDIDEPLGPKIDFIRSFELDRSSSLARNGGFFSPRDYLVSPGESRVKNYATILGGRVISRPERFDFDVSSAMRGFMAYRRTCAFSDRPWAYGAREAPSAYNSPVGGHTFGWGSHWYMYGFDERFLKHVLYYHFAEKGELHTWSPSVPPSQMSPEGISDLLYVRSKGNTTIPPHTAVRLAPLQLSAEAMRLAFVLEEFRWIFDSLLEIMRRHSHTGYCGNLFFHDISQPYFIELVPKQINLLHAAKSARKAVEIGFNAGHSAAIMLLANPSLTIRAFDTCGLAYTMPCVEFLNTVFENRITLVPGESRLTVRADAVHGYDLAHIDADHLFTAVTADLANCLPKCLDGAVVIMDDFERDNDVARATLQRTDLIPSETHMVCKVLPGSSHAMFKYERSISSQD